MTDVRPTEIGDVLPTSIRHIVGQRSVVEQVAVALDAAFADGKPMDSALLVGPPGVGKTTVAHVVASEMATELHEVLGQSIAGSAELNAFLLGMADKDVFFIDEAHGLPRAVQTALYLNLDQKRVLLPSANGGAPSGIPIAPFTLLLATTDEYCLLQPLRDRMKLTLRFEFYSTDELVLLLQQTSRRLEWGLDPEVLPLIAERSRGTPRLALRLLQAARRVCRADGEQAITGSHLERACLLEQIDAAGLGPVEQRYLDILRDGPVRLNVVASSLGLPARTVSSIAEPFLIRAGLITKDDQGRRVLTARGHQHCAAVVQNLSD